MRNILIMRCTVFLCTIVLLGLSHGLHTAGRQRPIVQTDAGELRGVYKISAFKGRRYNINHFLGIRYAKPPVGELRFMKPEPFVYDEPHEATEFGSACPQVDMMGLGVESHDEDCLFLNMFLPTDFPDTDSGHAVIIFIHGGSFAYGSSSLINGDLLAAAGNVIVVTFNYRLGLFGFLNPGDDTFPENAGLWDQRLAIQWVKDNIEKFAGDPNRITLMGESSGSASVILHGMYPPNEDLFHNLVSFSGTPFMPPGYFEDNAMAAQYLADMVSCYQIGDMFKTCMQAQNITKFMDALKSGVNNMKVWRRLNFSPTIDGDYIKANPMSVLLQSKQEHIDSVEFLQSLNLVTGVNNAEGGLWIMNMVEDIDRLAIYSADMAAEFIPNALPFVVGFDGNIPRVLIDMVLAEYTDWNNLTDSRLKYVKLMGDLNFNVPLMELGMVHSDSTSSKTWVFKFDALLPEHVLPTPNWLKTANHGDFLAPLFGFSKNFTFGRYKDIEDYTPSKWEQRLSRRIITHVSTFAKTG